MDAVFTEVLDLDALRNSETMSASAQLVAGTRERGVAGALVYRCIEAFQFGTARSHMAAAGLLKAHHGPAAARRA